MSETFKPGAARALFFSTTAFAVSFAVWGLVAALAPTFTQEYGLSAKAKSLLIAMPVLLGSLGRLPAGMLADRFGGRRVFAALLMLAAIPATAIGFSTSYAQLLWLALFLGLAGTTFSVGVGFTSKWFAPEKQGAALGVYGMGNIGQSLAVFGAPVLALSLGSWRPVFYIFAAVSLVWGVVFYLFARDAASNAKPKTLAENLTVLRCSPLAWVLSLFYFVTFGGFVAFSIYLPTLLKDMYGLSATDAGARTAGFVLVATLLRPVGGWLADKWGGARVLLFVFAAVALFGLLMGCPLMLTFTVGALGAAAALGLGNGAVFKLVPQHFPKETGTVTGLVGAFGGLGGFFPPLVLGVIRDATGNYWPGFILLAAFASVCLAINYFVFLRPSRGERAQAVAFGH
ncbi:MAG: transporter, family, nitrate/nitrite transporter [Pyrinomonadaceae bacterium]|jgi:NNP family nitrate/nitrite transporter-like MFS transporter|nr:transporter, family, nitrate/nitrite transporter [Pyrinomonadaceae bacterium]